MAVAVTVAVAVAVADSGRRSGGSNPPPPSPSITIEGFSMTVFSGNQILAATASYYFYSKFTCSKVVLSIFRLRCRKGKKVMCLLSQNLHTPPPSPSPHPTKNSWICPEGVEKINLTEGEQWILTLVLVSTEAPFDNKALTTATWPFLAAAWRQTAPSYTMNNKRK